MVATIREAGHTVRVAGGHVGSGVRAEAPGPEAEAAATGELPTGSSRARRAIASLTWGGSTVDWLDQLAPRPDAVILYGGASAFAGRVIRWATTNDVRVVVDAVEWYEGTHQPGGRYGPFALTNELAMRNVFPRARNVIAISSYLATHFQAKGCRVVTVPPTRDVMGTAASLGAGRGPVRFAYAGVPGRKDLLDVMVAGFARVHAERRDDGFRLDVAGISEGDLLAMPAVRDAGIETLPSWLEVHGRLGRDEVTQLVREADFVPLIRPDARYANAGFPTKVVESLTLGTPVLGNLTSDLGRYLINGQNAVLCEDASVRAFADAAAKAVRMTVDERSVMRCAARATAEASFDYRAFVETIRAFLEGLRPLA